MPSSHRSGQRYTAQGRRRLDLLWVGVGGSIGAIARYGMGRAIHDRVETTFPVGTLTINVLGSIAIGVLVTLLAERYAPNHALRLLIVTGFLGGYTTFSSYAYEAITLADRGQLGRSLIYIMGSNALALAGCAAGVALVRWLR